VKVLKSQNTLTKDQNPQLNAKQAKRKTKKGPKFVFANATACHYPIVREAMEEYRYKLTHSNTKCMFFWKNQNGSTEFALNLYRW
jgi:hypothetical protein